MSLFTTHGGQYRFRALHSLTRIESKTGFGPGRVPLAKRASRHAMFGRQLRHRRPHAWGVGGGIMPSGHQRRWLFAG
eukprot:4389417-Prymnesium_polylepis.1